MAALPADLVEQLHDEHVRIETPDADTVVLRGVQPNLAFFSKQRTDVLIKRPEPGMQFVACVDADLRYVGNDAAIVQAFVHGPHRLGWRALALWRVVGHNMQIVLEGALAALGFRGATPAVPHNPLAVDGLLRAFGTVLPRGGVFQPTIGRTQELDRVLACLRRRGEARLSLIVGESGSGKTNLLDGISCKLAMESQPVHVVSINLPRLLAAAPAPAQRSDLLCELLDQARATPQAILAVEHIEILTHDVPHEDLVLARFMDDGGRLIGTTLPPHMQRLLRAPLGRRIDVTMLTEPEADQMLAILESVRVSVASHYGIEIDPCCVGTCLRQSRSLPGSQPGKAIALFDAAVAQAQASSAVVVGGDDIYAAAAIAISPNTDDGQ